MDFSPAEATAILLTLKVAVVSVAASLPFGVAMAYALARGRFPGKALLDGLVHLPLVLPPVVIGYILLLLFSPVGPGGVLLERLFGITIAFRWTGAALAAAIMGFPLMVRAMRLSIEAIDERLELAARSLGRSGFSVFFTITLPLMAPGILAGTILAFARGLGEFGATITFVSNIPGETQTLPIAIYSFLQVPGADAAVLRLAILAILLSLASLFASEWLARRIGARRAR
ncbi:MAG TPA: molybdate ABC transporter permease subunit [Sphingomonadaceae bacterium]|nr:molybdate ABC transporter permease subunit [Sphingomonadaceae bacterium]